MECFDYIKTGRRFGKDFQTGLVKLSLFKLRLSRWETALRVYDDPQLGHPGASQDDIDPARNTLYQMLMLLADSEKVSKKFRRTTKAGEDLSVLSSPDGDTRIVALDNNMRQHGQIAWKTDDQKGLNGKS